MLDGSANPLLRLKLTLGAFLKLEVDLALQKPVLVPLQAHLHFLSSLSKLFIILEPVREIYCRDSSSTM